jgi:hypothetical protein
VSGHDKIFELSTLDGRFVFGIQFCLTTLLPLFGILSFCIGKLAKNIFPKALTPGRLYPQANH